MDLRRWVDGGVAFGRGDRSWDGDLQGLECSAVEMWWVGRGRVTFLGME